jgi:L-fucose isomerase
MRGKSYLSIGGVSMGIAGSFLDPLVYQKTFGMRAEWVDQVEIERRIAREIYDPEEYTRALAWVREHCKEGMDENPPETAHTREQKDAEWERVVKTTLICRDLLVGNPKLASRGWGEEALGHNALIGGIQGQRQWTDHFPNHDFTEAMLCSSFDWNGIREPFVFATENDNLNAMSMLMGHLLSRRAAVFADVRTYWSPEAIRRVTGWKPKGAAEGGMIHMINSGAASLDGAA